MDGRNSLGIRTGGKGIVFASDSDADERASTVPFKDGFNSEYESSKFPLRQDFNDVLAYTTAVANDVNIFGGSLPWNENVSYKEGAIVVRYDSSITKGRMFYALMDNTGKDPLNSAEWQDMRDFLGVQTKSFDFSYKAIESYDGSTSDLIGTEGQTKSYTISKFENSSDPSFNPANIRYLVAYVYVKSNDWDESVVYATIPDSSADEIKLATKTSHSGGSAGYTINIPVNQNGSITIRSNSGTNIGNGWTIRGAMQVTNY